MLTSKVLAWVDRVGDVGVGFPVIGRHFSGVIGGLSDDAELAAGKDVRIDEGAVQFLAAAKFHMTKAKLSGHGLAFEVKGAAGANVDITSHGRTGHVRRDRLFNDDLAGNGRWDIVEP